MHNSLLSLNRVVSLLRGKRFDVISLSATLAPQPGGATLTIVLNCDQSGARRAVHCLEKLQDVLSVDEI
jgi:acetolactate synthase small subunit